MKHMLFPLVLIGSLVSMPSYASPRYDCTVNSACSYTVYGMEGLGLLDFTIDITHIPPHKHYTCDIDVEGSNIDKIYIRNLYSKPDEVMVQWQPLGAPANGTQLVIDTEGVTGNSDVYFDGYSSRYPWQSNQFSLTCHEDHTTRK